jgi:hypothetical protein
LPTPLAPSTNSAGTAESSSSNSPSTTRSQYVPGPLATAQVGRTLLHHPEPVHDTVWTLTITLFGSRAGRPQADGANRGARAGASAESAAMRADRPSPER